MYLVTWKTMKTKTKCLKYTDRQIDQFLPFNLTDLGALVRCYNHLSYAGVQITNINILSILLYLGCLTMGSFSFKPRLGVQQHHLMTLRIVRSHDCHKSHDFPKLWI